MAQTGTTSSHGYRLIYVGKSHHLSDISGYAYEHRIVAEGIIGRKLKPGEEVHHKDGNKLNNLPDNLEVVKDRHHHMVFHRKGNKALRMPNEANTMVYCKCGCGQEFLKYDTSGRGRNYVSGHNKPNNFLQQIIINEIRNKNDTTAGLLKKHGKSTVKTALTTMVKAGIVKRISRGKYKLNGTTN